MILRPLALSDERAVIRAHEMLAREEFPFLFDFRVGDDFPAYVARVEAFNAGGLFSEGGVPGLYLVAEERGEIVGRLSLRYRLNAYLREFGGHLGYCVLPAYRRRGHAATMLLAGLGMLWQRGLEEALVTCDEDNAASIAVIERGGGRHVKTRLGEKKGDVGKRHYVFLPGAGSSGRGGV